MTFHLRLDSNASALFTDDEQGLAQSVDDAFRIDSPFAGSLNLLDHKTSLAALESVEDCPRIDQNPDVDVQALLSSEAAVVGDLSRSSSSELMSLLGLGAHEKPSEATAAPLLIQNESKSAPLLLQLPVKEDSCDLDVIMVSLEGGEPVQAKAPTAGPPEFKQVQNESKIAAGAAGPTAALPPAVFNVERKVEHKAEAIVQADAVGSLSELARPAEADGSLQPAAKGSFVTQRQFATHYRQLAKVPKGGLTQPVSCPLPVYWCPVLGQPIVPLADVAAALAIKSNNRPMLYPPLRQRGGQNLLLSRRLRPLDGRPAQLGKCTTLGGLRAILRHRCAARLERVRRPARELMERLFVDLANNDTNSVAAADSMFRVDELELL